MRTNEDQGDFPAGVALVVGGSGGIGAAVVATLAEAGAAVALTYRRNREAGEAAAAGARERGVSAEVHALDLADVDAIETLVADLITRHHRVHTVIHAVGADIEQPYISQVKPDQWRRVMEGEAQGFFNLVHGALPALREGDGGALVAVTSSGLVRYPPGDILSVAPKATIEALVRGVAREEGRYGVRANCVAIGVIEAGIFLRLREEALDAAWLEAARRNTPLRRFGQAQEAAQAVVFLASSRASYITGQTLQVDGGYTV